MPPVAPGQHQREEGKRAACMPWPCPWLCTSYKHPQLPRGRGCAGGSRPSSSASSSWARAINTTGPAAAPVPGHWTKGICNEGPRESEPGLQGLSWTLPSPEDLRLSENSLSKAQAPVAGRGGGSDKSFKSSFNRGGDCCWKWATRARKPQQLQYKQPKQPWQTLPFACSCLTRPRAPLNSVSAP